MNTGLSFNPWARVAPRPSTVLKGAEGGIREPEPAPESERLRPDWQATITREARLDQVPTMGGHNRVPADRLAELLDGLGNVIDEHGGSFTMTYATIALIASRRHEERLSPNRPPDTTSAANP